MADASLLELPHHLTWQPPAIVGASPSALGSSALLREYEQFLAKNERDIEDWEARGVMLRSVLWAWATKPDPDLTLQKINEMIALHQRNLRNEARAVERMKNLAAREERNLPASILPTV
ncbi:hypothetical protein [Methylobacterium isbiliense]|jgi:hypothetical protein|uniref:hypothetical protein n=1 Tax=Methylobacterium isbiliense TaxID=315478 RepID=UPI001EDD0AF5|nr:hypothetical protein [Methylobacterium isbiliense]MDN3627420.1 hypothetical protein [Methylobacterium isbiliense]